jgi:hypothetical protein
MPRRQYLESGHTESSGPVVNTPASFPGGPVLKSRTNRQISWQDFRYVPEPLQENAEHYLKLDHNRILPYLSQYTAHLLIFGSV